MRGRPIKRTLRPQDRRSWHQAERTQRCTGILSDQRVSRQLRRVTGHADLSGTLLQRLPGCLQVSGRHLAPRPLRGGAKTNIPLCLPVRSTAARHPASWRARPRLQPYVAYQTRWTSAHPPVDAALVAQGRVFRGVVRATYQELRADGAVPRNWLSPSQCRQLPICEIPFLTFSSHCRPSFRYTLDRDVSSSTGAR